MTARPTRFAAAVTLAASLLTAACSGSPGGTAALPQQVHALTNRTAPVLLTRPSGTTGSVVYVADAYGNTVWIFPAAGLNPSPIGSITSGVSGPSAVAIDNKGTLYVANSTNNTVTIYPPGATSPSLTLTQGLSSPGAVAIDSKHNVWVSNELGSFQGSVVEFPAGKTKPATTIGGLNPYGIAFDSKDNLYVAAATNTVAHVLVYPPGKTKPAEAFGGKDLIQPQGITVGPTGDVYVCDYQQNNVYIYASGTHKLLKKFFVEAGDLGAMTIANNKRLYIADTSNTEVVSEASDYGFGTVLANHYHNSLTSAFGVAADPIVPAGP